MCTFQISSSPNPKAFPICSTTLGTLAKPRSICWEKGKSHSVNWYYRIGYAPTGSGQLGHSTNTFWDGVQQNIAWVSTYKSMAGIESMVAGTLLAHSNQEFCKTLPPWFLCPCAYANAEMQLIPRAYILLRRRGHATPIVTVQTSKFFSKIAT